jgi:DNA-binding Lrp family transcriptional regulator
MMTQKGPTGRLGPEESKLLRAFVLVQTVPGRVGAIVGEIQRIKAVREVETVTGPYDIVVRLEVDDLREISPVVAGKIGGLKGVTRTTTLLCL